MGVLNKKVLGLLAGLMMVATSAQAEDQQIAPMSANDVRIIFEKSVEELKAKIAQSKNLNEEERISLSNDIEEDANRLRSDLTAVVSEAAKMGGTTYVAGLILGYTGEMNLPTSLFPKLALAPGAEMGLAVFLRDNSYVADSFSGAVAVMGGGSAKLTPGTQQSRKIEKGLRVKVLIAANRSEDPMIRLSDFAGAYAGLGGEMNLFARSVNARIYTRPTSCANANPLNCSVYMLSISTQRDLTETTPVEASVKGLYLDFPYTYGDRP